jgi:hypothetical protein
MPRGNKILIRTGSAAPSAADFAVSEPAWDSSSGKLYVKSAAGSMVEVGAGGASSLATYATAAGFPATGSATVLYLAEDTSRLFQWESPVYVEIGTAGGGFSHAASHAAGGSDAITPASIGAVATSDSRLTDTRTPTDGSVTTAKIADGSITTAKIAENAVVTADIADAAVTDAKITAMAAAKLTGTLADARLSSNVPLLPGMMLAWGQSGTFVETVFRPQLAFNGLTLTSGTISFQFFTPLFSLSVSQIAMNSGSTAASGLTLARMGLFTFDETTATLVARTSSDTTLFTATRTQYQRSFSTAGGFPSAYTLQAGVRYGVGVICVGTTMPLIWGATPPFEILALTPRLSAARSSQSDLGTTASLGTSSSILYARLS